MPYTSTDAELNAVQAGSIDVAQIQPDQIPQVPAVKRLGYNVFGIPD